MSTSAIRARDFLETQIGTVVVEVSDVAILNAEIIPNNAEIAAFAESESAKVLASTAVVQLGEYFAGTRTEFDLPTELIGTSFQKAVWKEISDIGFGEQLTYGEIAARIGNPVAARAVGAAVGANPVPIIVPCHRVMGASKKITGYSGGEGIPTKKWLLNFERIEYVD